MSVDEIQKWADKTIEEMKKHNINFDNKAIFLTGINYRKFIQDKFRQHDCPTEGKQIGDILHWFDMKMGYKNESLSQYLMHSFEL